MKTRITVNVTKRDIKKGMPSHNLYCPVALAVSRVLADGLIVNAGPYFIGIYDPSIGEESELNTPFIVREFMWAFDRRDRSVRPISFSINIPERLVKR